MPAADALRALGYCVTSRKFGLISRIDREDWKEYMASKHVSGNGMAWVKCLGEIGAEDHYRRCYSKDTLEIGSRARKLPKSHETVTGFRATK